MARNDSEIRPETYALDALIRETLARGHRRGTAANSDALLFLGNRHHAFPVVVVHDPILEPVDKLVWMIICESGQSTGTKAVFPSYAAIARLANVSSTSTVSRAIAILRATRWLSLCARSREANGRFSGNVYALHDEPLPLADALHLDPGYMTFLDEAANHHHARVRRVAAAVSASLDEDIRAGRDVLAPVNSMARRLDAIHAIQHRGDRRYFSFSADVLASLSNTDGQRGRADQDQNSKGAKPYPQKSKSARRSSRYINTNTTTTTPTASAGSARAVVSLDTLIVPSRLKDNQRALVARYLATIPVEDRQPVLDELAGRFQAEQHGAKPVYDALRYLHHLCVQVNRGGFVPNLGLKTEAEREQRRLDAERLQEEAAEREERPVRPPGESPIAEIRKLLGMPKATKPKPR